MAILFGASNTGYFQATVSNAPTFTAAKTIFLRFNIATYGTFNQGFFNIVNTASTAAIQLGTRYQSPTLTYLCAWVEGLPILVSTNNPALNVWTALAYTYDGVNNNLYVNGSLVGTSTTAVESGSITGAHRYSLVVIGQMSQ